MPTTTIIVNDKCSQLVNTPGVPITSIDGRLNGNQITFMNYTYNDLKMRRKAEVLKYLPSNEITTKSKYSYTTKNNYYSQAKLQQFINRQTEDCPGKTSTSSCSGVVGSNNIYYLDPKIPYFPSI
jgi:hypothetical protein